MKIFFLFYVLNFLLTTDWTILVIADRIKLVHSNLPATQYGIPNLKVLQIRNGKKCDKQTMCNVLVPLENGGSVPNTLEWTEGGGWKLVSYVVNWQENIDKFIIFFL